jgi:acetolactate synthase-1/2/3 large subunit
MTNTVTGLSTRCATPSPWSASPARCRRRLIGTDAFQECDTLGITRPCTKHNYLVRDVRLPPRAHEARP